MYTNLDVVKGEGVFEVLKSKVNSKGEGIV